MTLSSVSLFEFPPGDTPHSFCLGSKCIVHIPNRLCGMLKKPSTGDGFWLINFLNVFFFPHGYKGLASEPCVPNCLQAEVFMEGLSCQMKELLEMAAVRHHEQNFQGGIPLLVKKGLWSPAA